MASSVRIIETCKITPPPELVTESSLPLTFFDIFWLKYHPIDGVLFYEINTDSSYSFSTIVERLKKSLSLTLAHFLPLAGNLVWPTHSDKPFILYTPGDGISFSVAESNADFHGLSGDSVREVTDLHHYIPKLSSSDSQAATMSFQITFFPHQGFCLGTSFNHTVFDGRSIMMFYNVWVYICQHIGRDNGNPNLPSELTPNFDRTVIQDRYGLEMLCLKLAKQSGKSTTPRSLKVQRNTADPDVVRATFKLSNEDINKIRQKTLTLSKTEAKFSKFVLVYSYVTIALAKAKAKVKGIEVEPNENWVFKFTADARDRIDLAIPSNYFGSCIIPNYILIEAARLMKEDGPLFVAEEITKLIKGLHKGGLIGMKNLIEALMAADPTSVKQTGVAASPQFGVYGIDFGWGKPKKAVLTSIDHGMAFSMGWRPDENAIEVGLVLNKHEMGMFSSLFYNDFGKSNITS